MLKRANENIAQFTSDPSQTSFFQGHFQSKNIVRDPLVTGYAFIKWLKLPSWVVKEYTQFAALTEKNLRNFGGLSDIDMNTFAIQEGFSASENQFAGGNRCPQLCGGGKKDLRNRKKRLIYFVFPTINLT